MPRDRMPWIASLPATPEYVLALNAILLLNAVVLTAAIALGPARGLPEFYFREKEVATFLSAFQLFASALLAFLLYAMDRRAGREKGAFFWILCSAGALWMAADEWFMIHEGIDDTLLGALGMEPQGRHFLWDWVLIAAYGVAALVLAGLYRGHVLCSRRRAATVCLAGVFFVGTIAFDTREGFHTASMVEDAFKLAAVCFVFLFFVTAFFEKLERIASRGETV